MIYFIIWLCLLNFLGCVIFKINSDAAKLKYHLAKTYPGIFGKNDLRSGDVLGSGGISQLAYLNMLLENKTHLIEDPAILAKLKKLNRLSLFLTVPFGIMLMIGVAFIFYFRH